VSLDTIPWPKDKQPPHGALISPILSPLIAHPTLASGITRNQWCRDPESAPEQAAANYIAPAEYRYGHGLKSIHYFFLLFLR